MRHVDSYKDIKICCYAMAADEPEQFIDNWLESMKPANYITVLVTKADNPNYAYFKKKQELPEFKDKLIVAEEDIKPWRFDVARNESMKLIPEDADILISTDIDEVMIEDFWDDYRKCAFEHPDFERIYYQYAWSHDKETGDPIWYFWYDKTCQARGWRWKYPVHEALECPDIANLGYHGTYRLDPNKIYLHHYPDMTKSRGSYLGLLELRAQEFPNDFYGLYYLSREYSYANNWEKSLSVALELYTRMFKGDPNPEQLADRDDMLMSPCICILVGDAYSKLSMRSEAMFFYQQAIKRDPTYRDGYIKLAQLYAYSNMPQDCYKVIDDMEKYSRKITDWRLNTSYWRDWKKYQILADAKCWEGEYQDAKNYMFRAQEDIKTPDDARAAYAESFFEDLRFVNDIYNKRVLGQE